MFGSKSFEFLKHFDWLQKKTKGKISIAIASDSRICKKKKKNFYEPEVTLQALYIIVQ